MRAANDLTHIFFDLHGTLLDPLVMRQQIQDGLCRYLVAHYGGTAERWREADEQIVSDWYSYHADLNFSGDEGLRDYYESLYRVTRARFRFADIPEPPHEELLALSRTLLAAASVSVHALYPEVEHVLRELVRRRVQLGIASYIQQAQIEAILHGCGIRELFQAPLIGFDTVEQYERDQRYFEIALRLAQAQPACSLFVDDGQHGFAGALSAGMQVAYLQRGNHAAPEIVSWILEGSLLPLLML